MSIELMKRALEFITGVYFGEHEGSRADREKLEADLTTAIQQAEAQQPAAGEPVARVDYSERGNIAWLFGPQLPDGTELFKRPAPSVPKDDQIAALVNKVRDIARMFHDHQSLRERIAIELVPALKASQEVKSNAERWRYAIADGGNQSMNFIDIFGDWDGDGDFVEVFDAARLADKKGGAQ